MKQVTIKIDEVLFDFYAKVARQAGKSPQQVMADALFRLAGELAMEAIDQKNRKER